MHRRTSVTKRHRRYRSDRWKAPVVAGALSLALCCLTVSRARADEGGVMAGRCLHCGAAPHDVSATATLRAIFSGCPAVQPLTPGRRRLLLRLLHLHAMMKAIAIDCDSMLETTICQSKTLQCV
jgi:hypothetical protein